MNRTPLRLLLLLLAVSLTAVGLVAPAQAAAPYCGITWGSTAESGSTEDPATGAAVAAVRAGEHDCYDRLVVDVRGVTTLTTWRVEYVPGVTEDASGNPVTLRGGAFLQLSLGASQGYRPADPRELAPVAGFATFRQVAPAGSFEGVTTIGLGVRARLPFRVVTMTGIPGSANGVRVVLDVAHRW
jgi:hypothetical protein